MSRIGKLISKVVLINFVALNGAAYAEVFKWVDANGKVHYSDRKNDASAVELNVSTGAASLGQSSQNVEQRLMQQKKYLNYLESERLERKEKRAKVEQQKAKQKKYCTSLQDQLRSYIEENVRWYELNEESGERSFISDDDLEKRKQELRAEINISCS